MLQIHFGKLSLPCAEAFTPTHTHTHTTACWHSGNLCQRFPANLSVIIALGKVTDSCFATMQSDPLRNDILIQGPIFASIISPLLYQSTCLVSVPTKGIQSNYCQGNLTWNWKGKKKQITTNAGYFWQGHWLCQFTKCNDACQNSDKSRQKRSFVGAFEEHFAVTLSTVFPLAKEMPFTETLKIIKHIMDITVTLWLVCSFVWVWLPQLRPY